jgi:hypothetical protein
MKAETGPECVVWGDISVVTQDRHLHLPFQNQT